MNSNRKQSILLKWASYIFIFQVVMGKKEKSLGVEAQGRAVCVTGTSEVNYPSSCSSAPLHCFSLPEQPIDVNVTDSLEG